MSVETDRSEWDLDDDDDAADEECPRCFHGASMHDLDGCGVPGCECPGP